MSIVKESFINYVISFLAIVAEVIKYIHMLRFGSSTHGVGVTLPGFYTKIDNIDEHGEGEICMAGRHLFMGYLNDPNKTAEAKDKDGWLHTGDLGKLDSKGNLFITGGYLFLVVYHVRTPALC